MEQQMTAKQALEILDKVTSNVQLSRQDHQAIIVSLQTLDTLVKASEAPEPKK